MIKTVTGFIVIAIIFSFMPKQKDNSLSKKEKKQQAMSENNTKKLVVKLHPDDNVLVALTDLQKGETIHFENETYVLQDLIKAKHKFYMQDMKQGEEVNMYGVLVGKVQNDVAKGSLMTTENLKHAADPYAYRNASYEWNAPDVSKFENRTFKGYKRKDGRVGTANYWLFVPTVFCENRNLDVIKEALHKQLGYAVTDKYNQFTHELLEGYLNGNDINDINIELNPTPKNKRVFENVDGIKFLNHQGGCGGTRQDASTLSALLASYANHPNVGGITLLSLGCQHLQVQDFVNDVKRQNPEFDKPLFIFEQQQTESEEVLITNAIKKTFEGLIEKEAFPFYVLFLSIDPAHIDINVHPTKTEIKFDDERSIYAIVQAAVRKTLSINNLIPSLDFETNVNFNVPTTFGSPQRTIEKSDTFRRKSL